MLALLLSYLLVYKYVALFAFVLAIAIIVPLPANGILLAAGAFASFGYFNIWISIAVAVTANVAGDTIDYLIARHYGPSVFSRFKIDKHYYFERLRRGFRDHAALTIFVTRFVGPLDLFASLFAGSVGIPAATFVWYDFLGNFVSASMVIAIGYFAGSYWQNFSGLIDIFGWTLFAVIALFLILKVFLRHRRQHRPIVTTNLIP